MKTRFLYKTGSTITDESVAISSYNTGSATLTMDAADALYIGQEVPFNHLYFKMDTLNTNSADLTVELWDGAAWVGIAELIDETNGLQSSGFVSWTPDKDEGWAREDTDDSVTDLETVKIYDLYWIKITTSATLTETVFNWLGQQFNTDEDLYSLYPLFAQSNMKTAFEAGKTTWEEQIVKAGEEIIRDLIRSGIVNYSGQVLRRDLFLNASIHKVAEIIYRSFGKDYIDDKTAAHGDYKAALNLKQFKVDLNNNAKLDIFEQKTRTGFMTR